MIKLVQMDHYKGGERITMLAGGRALGIMEKKKNIKEISALLCAKECEAAEAVARLKEEAKAEKKNWGSCSEAFESPGKGNPC